METLTATEQTPSTDRQLLASEAQHWYRRDGSPCYEVEAKKGGMRPATLADARKLDLVPSVTMILNVADKPGLEAWKAKQILEASLTLPRIEGESLDDYAVRVMEDAKAQGKAAADKGTQLHAAIELWIQGKSFTTEISTWAEHIGHMSLTLREYGIDLTEGNAEHSFASPLGYGGKIDFHNDFPLIIDFKTKERIEDKKQLAWPEHIQQLAAYGFGLFKPQQDYTLDSFRVPLFRALNVFIGVQDKQVRVFEYEWPDIVEAFAQFRCLLEFWQRVKKFGPYAMPVQKGEAVSYEERELLKAVARAVALIVFNLPSGGTFHMKEINEKLANLEAREESEK